MKRHTFFGPNGIEVNEREFGRLLTEMGNKSPITVRIVRKKKRRGKKKKVWKRSSKKGKKK